MEEELRTQYEPLKRGPLRLQGVFGIARILYKRCLPGILPLTLLLVTLPAGLMYALQGTPAYTEQLINGMNGLWQSGTQSFVDSMHMLTTSMWISLLSLVFTFLLSPAYTGALYLELDQTVSGRRGSLRQLLRYALPVGLRQYYTTFLSQYALLLGIGFVMVVILLVLMVATLIPIILTSSGFITNWLNGPFIWIMLLVVFLINLATSLCVALVYPVAVRENKRAFQAVGRAMHLAAKHFSRILSVIVIYHAIVFAAVILLLVTPVAAARGQLEPGFAYYLYGIMLLLQTVLTPFAAALNTALYIDAASREDMQKRKRRATDQDVPPTQGEYGKPIKPLFVSRQEPNAPSDSPSKERPPWDGPAPEAPAPELPTRQNGDASPQDLG